MKEHLLSQPLADKIRPQSLGQFIGQTHLLGKDGVLSASIATHSMHSMIFWGPPGSGKTTLAKLLSKHFDAHWISISAVLSGVREIRQAIEDASTIREQQNRPTILFVDEVHRFNKSQQDAFLPSVENGLITFIGATTENPSFALNNALLSRAKVYLLKSLTISELHQIAQMGLTYLNDHNDIDNNFSKSVLDTLCEAADGDARRLLNLVELAVSLVQNRNYDEAALLQNLLRDVPKKFDRMGDVFYQQISALHKSIRGSDPDAALYWLCRMLQAGGDPLYIARRLLRIASEDIGNADPRALQITLQAFEVQERLGSPEGELALAQATIFLSCAAKSNAVYVAFKKATEAAQMHGSLSVPTHLCNATTSLMKKLGYGSRYKYAHDYPDAYVTGEQYFPDNLPVQEYYLPTSRGLEKQIKEKLVYLKSMNNKTKKKP